MEIVKGNLIDLAEQGKFNIIIHGCNCFNTMGAGIAKEIATRYPEAYKADLQTIKGDRNKLGTYTSTTVTSKEGNTFTIINAYTQYFYGRAKNNLPLIDYDALLKVLTNINNNNYNLTIGMPFIGCGLAKGDWNIVSVIINSSITNNKIIIVSLN